MSRLIIRQGLTESLYKARADGTGLTLSWEQVCALLPEREDCDATQRKEKRDVHIRWLIRRDMQDVLRVEQQCYTHPWDEEEFLQHLRQRNVIGMVCEDGPSIVGYMLYELHKGRLNVLKMAVEQSLRRCGIGTAMIARLRDKLSMQRRKYIDVSVSDDNLIAQKFLSSCGLVASPNGDWIDFRYTLKNETEAAQ